MTEKDALFAHNQYLDDGWQLHADVPLVILLTPGLLLPTGQSMLSAGREQKYRGNKWESRLYYKYISL